MRRTGIRWLRCWKKRPEAELAAETITHLIGGLRGGLGLEEILGEKQAGPELRPRLRALARGDSSDALGQLLWISQREGTSCLAQLRVLRLVEIRRAQQARRAKALSAQARMQALLLALLPWMLLPAFAALDAEILRQAKGNFLSWLLGIFALLSTLAGWLWIRRILRLALAPVDAEALAMEEELPLLVQQLLTWVSAGLDPGLALARSSETLPEASPLRPWLQNKNGPGPVSQLLALLARARDYGSPLREELLQLLEDLVQQRESKWEERLQKLPLKLLAPLFLCSFPAALAVLAALLLPMLSTA